MDKRTIRERLWSTCWLLLALVAFVFGSCKDDNKSQIEVYDPNKPVAITDFTPKTGGGNSRLIIYGENFGTDPSLVKVTVGGKDAKVINVQGNSIYCMVAQKSYRGDIKLTIGSGQQVQTAVADEKFVYVRQMVVSTLCGYKDEKGNYDIKDGPFDDCGGFANPTWFSFDPKNSRYLYLAQDGNKPMRLFDLQEKYVHTVPGGNNGMERMRTITWTVDGDTMIIANDQGAEDRVNNSYLVRNGFGKEAFMNPKTLQVGKQCNGSAIHPVNHELYYNSFGLGEVFKFDYWKSRDFNTYEKLYNIQDRDWEFHFQIHPTGNYAYIVVVNQNYIMRTDYNWTKKTFGTPYLVCGKVSRDGDWVDKVGEKARLSGPYQGVFVKNDEYVKEKREDVYDFYFCERGNQCVRILTPDGSVTTFAGRGSLGVNSDAHGYINGALRTEARFHDPAAIAYDEATKSFYIGDIGNHRIRKIALEEATEEEVTEVNN